MKRTEKVEIRVSQEEKQTLTELAKQDGDSVSGLIRGLVEKYIALNSTSKTRRLPKWQIAAGLGVAALIGHGLTLLPMHLHDREHQATTQAVPIYMVHGAIDNSAFGVGVNAKDANKELTLNHGTNNAIRIKLAFAPSTDPDDGGFLSIFICEIDTEDSCEKAFETKMEIDRVAPSVLGNNLASGKPVHIFVQEMA